MDSQTPELSTADKKQRVASFLNSYYAGVLATVGPDNNPHAAVVYYGIDDKLNLLFTTKTRTKKSDNLKHNDHAEFVVFDVSSQAVVQIMGTVWEITDPLAAQEAFAATQRGARRANDDGVAPITKLQAGAYVAYRLVPAHIHMAVYGGRAGTDDSEHVSFTLDSHEL